MQDITAVETRRQHIICQRLHGFILIQGIDSTFDMGGPAGQPNQPLASDILHCTATGPCHVPLEEQTGCDIKPISHPRTKPGAPCASPDRIEWPEYSGEIQLLSMSMSRVTATARVDKHDCMQTGEESKAVWFLQPGSLDTPLFRRLCSLHPLWWLYAREESILAVPLQSCRKLSDSHWRGSNSP